MQASPVVYLALCQQDHTEISADSFSSSLHFNLTTAELKIIHEIWWNIIWSAVPAKLASVSDWCSSDRPFCLSNLSSKVIRFAIKSPLKCSLKSPRYGENCVIQMITLHLFRSNDSLSLPPSMRFPR